MDISFEQNILSVAFDGSHCDPRDIAAAFARLTDGNDCSLRCGHRDFWAYLRTHFGYAKAAGGIVHNGDGQWLLIRHYGHWDLPKGLAEQGESRIATAMREVCEETGIDAPTAEGLFAKTYHIHNRYGQWQLKQTSWFLMLHAASTMDTRPQTSEDIDLAEWVAFDVWRKRLAQSYATMRHLSLAVENNIRNH